MGKNAIHSLLSETPRRHTHARYRYTPKQLAAVEKDLKELIEAERAGAIMPTRARIIVYLEAEHGVRVASSTLSLWLTRVRDGRAIA